MSFKKVSNYELLFLPYHTIYARCGLSGYLNKNCLCDAIQDIVKANPFFDSKISRTNNAFYYDTRIDCNIAIEVIAVNEDSQNYHDLLDSLQNSICDFNAELIKFFIIVKEEEKDCARFDIAILVSHFLVDGQTAMKLIHQVLLRYNALLNKSALPINKRRYPPSVSDIIYNHYNDLTPEFPKDEIVDNLFSENKLFTLTPEEYHAYEMFSFSTKTLDFEISGNKFFNMIQKCRGRNVTVNSFLSACMINSAIITFDSAREFEFLSHQVTMNLKNTLGRFYIKDELNSCPFEKVFVYEIAKCKNIWELAESVGRDVKKCLFADNYLRRLKFLLKMPSCMLLPKSGNINDPVVNKNLHYATTISNMGKVSFPKQIGKLSIDYLNASGVRNNGRHFLTITSIDDSMYCRLSYTVPKYDPKSMTDFFYSFYKMILDNIS